mgnify:CR=1 FL=1
MSSHHIVREKQEPALLILTIAEFDAEHLGQLLEWSPTVFVSEAVYVQADATGIKIDGVLTSSTENSYQLNTVCILSDNNYLEDGLKYFISEGYPAVNLITRSFVPKDFSLFVPFIDLVVYRGNKKIIAVRSGFSKWKSKGEKIELLQTAPGLRTSNLLQLGEQLFEVQNDGFYSFSFESPYVFIAETI